MSDSKTLDRAVRNFFSPDVGIGIARYVISFVGVLALGSILIMAQG